MGIGKLIIADYDVVVPSNLNRQQYFIEQIGMYKTNALKENLNKINPYVDIEVHNKKVRKDNIEKLFSECSIIVEAFDSAESKQMLIDYVLNNMDKKIISGWGMAGFGPSNDIKTKKVGKLYICGDGESSAGPGIGLMAPRVGICANHQANQVVRIIIKGE